VRGHTRAMTLQQDSACAGDEQNRQLPRHSAAHSRNQQKAWPLLPHAGTPGPQSNSASCRPQGHEWRLIMSQQATSVEILDQVRDLDDIEDMAVQLATLAGAEIVRTFG